MFMFKLKGRLKSYEWRVRDVVTKISKHNFTEMFNNFLSLLIKPISHLYVIMLVRACNYRTFPIKPVLQSFSVVTYICRDKLHEKTGLIGKIQYRI